jgi:homoserine kinase type II
MSLPPPAVLAAYAPALDGLRWAPVGGGFSGAAVWRGGDFALKAWPPGFDPDRLARVHAWTARAAHLPFVPAGVPTADRRTFTGHAGRLWDVTRWLPGTPLADPTTAEVEAACAAVAQLHAAWPVEAHGPSPGALNRLRVLGEFRPVPPPPGLSDELARLVPRAVAAVASAAPHAAAALRPWEGVALPLRPCVRDLRAEHVLFTGPAVTGVVDYGAMALDHPAVDLARLLGDYGAEDRFAAGQRAYRAAGGRLDAPDEFVRALDRAGAVCSVVGWLVRLAGGHISTDPAAVAARLRRLTARAEGFAGA